ncbi:Right handed beta helix region [Chthonomonas calidirosea]|nr:Right handed beta helix region [Chthonomonas calidirosea]
MIMKRHLRRIFLWLGVGGMLAGGSFGLLSTEAQVYLYGARRQASILTVHLPPNAPEALQQAIESAYKEGYRGVRIVPGTYPIEGPNNDFALRLVNMRDFEVDGRGVTLVRLNPRQGGIHLDHCTHVTLRGFTVRLATTVRTQGAIVAIDPHREWFDIVVDKGYPTDLDNPADFDPHPTAYFFDPKTLQWKPGAYDVSISRVERLGPNKFRFHGSFGADHTMAVGDLVTYRNYLSTDLEVSDCAGIRVVGLTFVGPTGWVVHEGGGEGGNFYNYSILYPPPPPGATRRPLMAAGADAFHSSGIRHGPTVEGCLLQGMPDDGIAIHGRYAMVQESNGNHLIVRVPWGNFFQVGDRVRVYTKDLVPLGEAKLNGVEVLSNYQLQRQTDQKAFKEGYVFVSLTLNHDLSAPFEGLVSDPDEDGSGYVLRNNIIRNNRARGLLLKADDGLVENNTIDGSTIAGIVIAPELWWNEADYSHHVVVRNNHIRHVGYVTWQGTDQAGAISVMASNDHGFVPGYGHQDIQIDGNTIESCDGVNLLVTSAENVDIRNNVFRDAQQHPSNRGANWLDPKALIYLTECKGVHLQGNRVERLGHENARLVEATKTALEVTGVSQGVHLAAR